MHPIYLDNASTSFPKPACVPDAVYRYMTACGSNVSRGGYRSAYSAEELVFETRERLCALFHGGDARCVVFTPNITTSLNLLLKGFLRPGDHVLVSAMEHNAVMRPLRQLEAAGAMFDRVPCNPDGVRRRKRLYGKTRGFLSACTQATSAERCCRSKRSVRSASVIRSASFSTAHRLRAFFRSICRRVT